MLGTYLMLLNDTAPDHISLQADYILTLDLRELKYPIIANPINEIKIVLV